MTSRTCTPAVLSVRSFKYTGDCDFTDFTWFITRFCDILCLVTVIMNCHHCKWLLRCQGEVSSMKEIYKQTQVKEDCFGEEESVYLLVFRAVGGCLAPHNWMEILPRGHSQNPSESMHYSWKCPVCAPCGVGASSFHTSFILQWKDFTKDWSGIVIKLPATREYVGPHLEDNLSATPFLSFTTENLLVDLFIKLLLCFAGGGLFTSHAKKWIILFGTVVIITLSREFVGLFFVVTYKHTFVPAKAKKQSIWYPCG